jgi:hypothetical protein
MKKILVVLLAAAVVLAASACSKKKGEGSEPPATVEEPEAARVETAAEGAEAEPEAESRASLPTDGEWQDAFKFVRDAIRTEPSRYPLKTPDGVEWGRSANPLEKALFLARLLQEKGMTVEIAEGELDDTAARSLLGAIFPAAKVPGYKSGTPISNPAGDRNLVAAVKRHFWVRLEEGDGWIDLDPSFPSAEPGKAFAEVTGTYDPADEALAVKVSLSVTRRKSGPGAAEPVLSWAGMMPEVVNKPMSLTVMTEYRGGEAEAKEQEEEAGGGVGGLFGGLSGGTSAKKKPVGNAEAYLKVSLMAGEESLAEGEAAGAEGAEIFLNLGIKFESLGEVVSNPGSVFFKAAVGRADAPLFQRHALLITGDRIPAAAWKDDLQTVSAGDARSEAKAEADEIRAALKAKKATATTLSSGVELEAKLGRELGHLMNMIFASTSDDQTEKAGAALSVASWYAVPRIIITSFGGSDRATETTIDLRQDRVESVALPGQAWGMSQAFQYGRGVMESILEGKLLALLTGKPALTTAFIMEEAARKNIPIRMFSSLEADKMKTLGLPAYVQGFIEGTLASSGRVVMIPERAISWEGRPRWGWWLVDPRTRETIGVLDTGFHQAMLEHTILQDKGAMSTKMGAVLGAMVGAVDTYWLLMGMILKYGELTKEALLEAKAYMKDIRSVMCPGFEKKISIEASVNVIDIEDCYSYDYEIFKAEAGIEIKQGWCAQFAKGFACASTSILNYYLSQFED